MSKYYFAMAVVSLDGKIALDSSHFTNWTSAEDTEHLKNMLAASDCILVGNNTYKTAEEPLSRRNCAVISRQFHVPVHTVNETLRYCNPAYLNLKQYFEQSSWDSICVLGGTQIYSLALELGILQDIFLTIEPLLFGTGLPFFEKNANRTTKSIVPECHGPARCTLLSYKKLNKGGTLLLHYRLNES